MTLHQFQSAKRGQRIVYHVGGYSSNIGLTEEGRLAMSLYKQGRAILVQRRISVSPRTYEYIAVKVK